VRAARRAGAGRARARAHGRAAGGHAGRRLAHRPERPQYPLRDMVPREHALNSISSDHFDVVVIGGGITGAGVALDAASRGFSVALVERGDYAIGTSSRSSKMIHGGLRYLQNL